MIKIEVTGNNRNVTTKTGVQFVAQEAYAHIPGQKYPSRIELLPPKGQQPYPAGAYTFGPDSFYVDGYNKLSLGLKLQPLKA